MALVAESTIESADLSWLERLGWAVRNGMEIAHGDLRDSNADTSLEPSL